MAAATVAALLTPARAFADDWGDEPACATTPEGCRRRTTAVAAASRTDAPSAFREHPWLFDGHLGVATPYGALGGALDVTLADWLAVSGGAGVSPSGLQLALMPRLRAVLGDGGRNALGVSLGVSTGRYVSHSTAEGLAAPLSAMGHSPPDEKVWDRAWWTNAGLGWERRPRRGPFAIRVYMGAGTVMNREAYHCERYLGYGCKPEQGVSLMYMGAALGMEL